MTFILVLPNALSSMLAPKLSAFTNANTNAFDGTRTSRRRDFRKNIFQRSRKLV